MSNATKTEAIIKLVDAYNKQSPDAFFNQGAEQALIGAVLHQPEVYPRLADIIQAGDFSMLICAYIWHAFKHLTAEGRVIDYLTVSQIVPTFTGIVMDSDIVLEECVRCMTHVPNIEHVLEYAHMVAENATRLRLAKLADDNKALAFDKSRPMREVLDTIATRTLDATKQSTERPTGLASLASAYYDDIEEGMQGEYTGLIASGFTAHDMIAQGYLKGEVHIITGGAGMGKSTWLLSQLRLMAKRLKAHNDKYGTDKRIVHFTMEMQSKSCIEKWVVQETGIPQWKLRKPKMLTPQERKQFTQAIGEISTWPIEIVDEYGSLKPVQMRTRIQRYIHEYGVVLVTVDGLWLMEPDTPSNRVQMQPDQFIHHYLTMRIAEVARDFDVPLILLHQYNQDAKGRRNKRPLLTDMKWGQAVQQDFHTIWGMYRARGEEVNDDTDPAQVKFYGLKGRSNSNIEGSQFDLYFDQTHLLYRDLELAEI